MEARGSNRRKRLEILSSWFFSLPRCVELQSRPTVRCNHPPHLPWATPLELPQLHDLVRTKALRSSMQSTTDSDTDRRLCQFAGFVVVSALAISTWVSQNGLGGGIGSGNTGTALTLNRHTVYLLLFVAAVALAFSILYLILTRTFTKLIMHATLVLSIALNM